MTNSSEEETSTASIDSIGEIDLPSVESGSSNLAPSDSTSNTASRSSSSSDAFTPDREGLSENTGNNHIDYPYQPRKVIFPLRSFGNVRRAFKAEWFDYKNWKSWLHYGVEKDAAFCATCIKATQKNFMSNRKAEYAFIKDGYRNWSDAATRNRGFDKHFSPD